MPKLDLEKILKKIEEAGAIHFSPEQGLETASRKLSQREALKELRAAGVDAIPTGGMYKGAKEGSIMVPDINNAAARVIIEKMARDTGQEALLEVGPKFEGRLMGVSDASKDFSLPKGVKVSDVQPEGENWTKINTTQGPKYLEYGKKFAQDGAGTMLRHSSPQFSMGEAFHQINEPIQMLNAPRDRAIQIAAQALGKQLDISGGKVPGMAEQNANVLNEIGQFTVPDVTGLASHGLSMAAQKAGKLLKPTAAQVLKNAERRGGVSVIPSHADVAIENKNFGRVIQPEKGTTTAEQLVKDHFHPPPIPQD